MYRAVRGTIGSPNRCISSSSSISCSTKQARCSLSGLLSCSLEPERWNLFKWYTGMDLLDAQLAALIVVLASVVALAVAQNKQGVAIKGFYHVAFSLIYGTCLKGIHGWMELLEARLAALIVVLAVVVAAAAPNKQGLAFKAGYYDAVSLYLGYSTNLVGM